MNPRKGKNLAKWSLPILSATVVALGCIGSGPCDSQRAEFYELRRSWAVCDPSVREEQCTTVPGQDRDCTGVFNCEFAVNVAAREVAQRKTLMFNGEYATCNTFCARSRCPSGPAKCDPVTRQCVMAGPDKPEVNSRPATSTGSSSLFDGGGP